MAKRVYPPETRAAVVAALLEGQAASKVAADYKLPEGTVKAWASRTRRGASELRSVAPEKRDEIGDLLIQYLRTNLATLKIQSEATFRDPAWLKKQNAADVAVLHGVLTDKTVRMLEALGNAGIAPKPAE
jgi:transposase-like protein